MKKLVIVKNFKWFIMFICIVSFILLAEDVFTNDIMQGDIIVYNFISKYLISDYLTPIVKIITWFGSASALIIFSIILTIFIKNNKLRITIFLNLIIITILNLGLKYFFHRPRPDIYRIINESGYSFPSGHSMISMAFYGYLIYLIFKYIENKYLKYFLIITLGLLILLIGFSRIYLGVHYTSDVIAGFAISISYLILFINITKNLKTPKIN